MNATHLLKSIPAAALLAATATGLGTAQAEESILRSSNPSQFEHWHGRAGGAVGSERIGVLHADTLPSENVSVTYDEDVAQRTNMQRQGVDNPKIGVTYDEAVAERTNMAREKAEPTATAAKSVK